MLALLSRRLALSVFVNGCNRRLVRQWNIKRTFTPILPSPLFLFFLFLCYVHNFYSCNIENFTLRLLMEETIQLLPVINHPLSPCFDIWKMRSFPRQVYSWRCHRSDPLIGWPFNLEMPSQKFTLYKIYGEKEGLMKWRLSAFFYISYGYYKYWKLQEN